MIAEYQTPFQDIVDDTSIDINLLKIRMRAERDRWLSTVDRVNPIWYNTLTEEERNQLVAYRQALLTVPEQAGFPTQIEWPQKPSWL
jgi:hypothetical protein